MRRACLAAALAVAACNPADPPPSPAPSDRTAPAVQAPEPRQDLPEEQRSPDLFGAWLVESVAAAGSKPADRFWDTILLVGLRQLEVLSQCITIGPFDYGRIVGGGISVRITPVVPRSSPPGRPAPSQCARGLTPTEQAIAPILLGARDVKVEGGRVILSGPAGSMVLRRPEGALRNPRGQSPPPTVPPLLGAWRFTTIDRRILPPGERMELLLRPRRLEWRSGCVGEARELQIDRDVLRPGEIDPFPVCERGRSPSELALERLFGSAVVARMEPDGRLRLEGAGVTAELEPLTS